LAKWTIASRFQQAPGEAFYWASFVLRTLMAFSTEPDTWKGLWEQNGTNPPRLAGFASGRYRMRCRKKRSSNPRGFIGTA